MDNNHKINKIYKEYHQKIVQYLARIVGPDDAEDLAQEVFNKINQNIENFRGDSKLSTWIYRIAKNTAIDNLKSAAIKHGTKYRPIEKEADIESQNIWITHKSIATDQNLIRKEMSECVKEFVDKLSPDYRIVIVLSELEGFTNKEIADILNISIDNVKIRLHRARAKLKEALNEGCDFYINEQNTLACDRKSSQILPKLPK